MKRLLLAASLIGALLPALVQAEEPKTVTLHSQGVTVQVFLKGFRYGFSRSGHTIAASHAVSGITVNDEPADTAKVLKCSDLECQFHLVTKSGATAEANVSVKGATVQITVTPSAYPARILLRTAGLSPSYGVGDRASEDHRDDTDLSGMVDDHLLAGRKFTRLTSNFVIFPKQGMAEILPDPRVKMLHLTAAENAQGIAAATAPVTITYFFGDTHQIYAEFLAWRNNSGYPVMMPKYALFGVGWEAFGALGWETNEKTVKESVDHYLGLGFPLSWAAIGSGFWPAPEEFHETTSFGLIDRQKYPDMASLLRHFHEQGLKVLFGLRITFITTGPYAKPGLDGGYFLKKQDGSAEIFHLGWPKLPCYVLDAQNPDAVEWYLGLVKKWTDLGVDGFKEDMFGFAVHDFRDDKLDPINQRLMKAGVYVVERNGYITSDGDIQRIDDFNFDQDQDRGPVNAMALAYAGLPLIFPDIVGGTFGEGRFDTKVTPRMEQYFMRDAQWASLHSSMSVGQPPWSFKNPEVGKVLLKAAQMHERLRPYLYSQAVRFVHEGYPWTLAPLPLAFPDDPKVYGRENKTSRGYEWMIGDALLAIPLYGDDYETATSRNIYLPQGTWMDYETGESFTGPRWLRDYKLPVEKTPLFVGGTGIVIEKKGEGLVARLYPVTPKATTQFWNSDSTTRSTFSVDVKDWNKIIVTDLATGSHVPVNSIRFANEFPFVPGHDYSIK